MTLQASGAISLANLQGEFGGANPIYLSEYYRSGGYVPSWSEGPPYSGTISLSQFYGASAAFTMGERYIQVNAGSCSVGVTTSSAQGFYCYVNKGLIYYNMYAYPGYSQWVGSATGMSTYSYGTYWRNEGESFIITNMYVSGAALYGTVNVYDAAKGWRWTGVGFGVS